MQRLHLFEFGDQPWLPRVIHDAEVAYLSASYRFLPFARLWAEKIATVLPGRGPGVIVDLCSGTGGALLAILDQLASRGHTVHAMLTDLYPSPACISDDRILVIEEPVDATRIPAELTGVRTMFSAFHHFRPEAAKA